MDRPRLGKKDAISTPHEFRDVLIWMARNAKWSLKIKNYLHSLAGMIKLMVHPLRVWKPAAEALEAQAGFGF
jgi:hypothetical protein